MEVQSAAREMLDYARDQAGAAACAQTCDELDGLSNDAFRGYRIVNRIKRGGQGVVYAGIEETTGRRVAIKVLRSGPFRGRTERLRFEREIRILAQLEHPHIVAIHGSGTVNGHPYYVMDHVAGRTLDEFIDSEDPPINVWLAMFLKICDAVHAAHLHGIVHRDLKPGNIRIDEHGEPHVLDFGLAKPVAVDVAGGHEEPDATMTGQFVGTLPWAAPEQLAGVSESADLRTDVYGLGLLLYTMLAKTPPFERSSNLRSMLDDILQHDPAPLREINPRVDDELNTIVSMCLHKEPGRRYQIAGELGRDVQRYRAGLPIEAKRDSTGYVLAKTIRRHRTVATLTALVVLLSVGYGVTVSVLYQNAIASEQLAEQRAGDARDKYGLARDALEFVVREVSVNLKDTPRSIEVRRTILEGAFERLNGLAEQHGDDPLLLRDLMGTHYQLGRIASELGRFDLARPHLQTALEKRLALHAEQTPTPAELAELSINYVLLGDIAHHSGESELCLGMFRKALAIDEQLAADHPDDAHFLDNLAWSYDRLGDLSSRHQDYAIAEEYHRKQLDLMERLVEREPENPIRLHGLAKAHSRMNYCAVRRCDQRAALRHIEQAVAAGRRARATGDDSPMHMRQYVNLLSMCAARRWEIDRDIDNSDLYFEMREVAKALIEHEPDHPRNRLALVNSWVKLAGLPVIRNNPEEWERMAREAARVMEECRLTLTPSDEVCSMKVTTDCALLAMLRVHGTADEVAEHRRRLLDYLDECIGGGFDSAEYRCRRAMLLTEEHAADPGDVIPFIDEAREAFDASGETRESRYAMLGYAYAKMGAHDAALEMYERAEQLAREHDVPMSGKALRGLREYRAGTED